MKLFYGFLKDDPVNDYFNKIHRPDYVDLKYTVCVSGQRSQEQAYLLQGKEMP